MMNRLLNIGLVLCTIGFGFAQKTIPLDTVHWDINAKSYVLENFKGEKAIYLQDGSMTLKGVSFLNGTIEYDIFLKKAPAFPGVDFRINDSEAEHFYLRPHQSGNPDANQAIPITKGISPWQLYYGPRYSFPYQYSYEDWTHVKIVVAGSRAQVYLNHASLPNLSWNLFHEPREGGIRFTGGNTEALHLANITIDKENHEIKDFNPIERKPIEGLVPQWEVSDKFEEKLIQEPKALKTVIDGRSWGKKIVVEEGTAANISREVELYNDKPGNTVFARTSITSDKDQIKLFEFGYSDRVVVILNGQPLYRGTNAFRSRDYRYLGTVGLFDAVYLDLKKGKNTLIMAVSEDFGGWLVTGRFSNPSGVKTN